MSDCEFCGVIKGEFESEKIFEDDKVVAVLHLKPAAPGHMLIFPKEHYTILEQVPEAIVEHIFNIANRLSMAMFEATEAQGSNIIIQNGPGAGQSIPHFAVNIIPRKENDKLELQWKAEKASDDVLDSAQSKIVEQLANNADKGEKKETVKDDAAKKEAPKIAADDYRVKHLQRIP